MCHSGLVRIAAWKKRERISFFSVLPTRVSSLEREKKRFAYYIGNAVVLALICVSLTMEQMRGFISADATQSSFLSCGFCN